MYEKIEEMAKDIEKTFTYAKKYYDDKYEPFELEVYPDEIARELYQKGYRKESDTARELLKWLVGKRHLFNRTHEIGFEKPRTSYLIESDEIEELAEKYGVDLD